MRETTKPSFLKRLMVGFMIYLIGGWPSLAFALPSGGEIVSGSGTISQPTAQDMVIQQNTQKMIADWQAFGIRAAESVQFVQPGRSSIALNRVIGADPSVIIGKLIANGQVFLSNPSGVLFAPGARVDVHGLVATTLKINSQDFLDGNYHFTQDPTRSLAAVINQGNIEASGYVGLLAPSVVNSGTIVADLGSVAIGAGTKAAVDFTGDGLINFTILDAVQGEVVDTEGNVLENRIENSGLIQADGGKVLLTAKDAGDVIRNVVNHSGTIIAHSIAEKNGEIYLLAAGDGIVNITGTVDASGDDAGETGGLVEITGEKVGLFDTAVVDVSGDAGGGTARIGGDFQGVGDLATAQFTYVGEHVVIDADALTLGDGGTVIVWADEVTRFYGSITARGGAQAGDGGFIETSGKQYLDFNGAVDASATNGDIRPERY